MDRSAAYCLPSGNQIKVEAVRGQIHSGSPWQPLQGSGSLCQITFFRLSSVLRCRLGYSVRMGWVCFY
ncbi:unnamed protein product [Amoebophrya sp. A120]|nr:unnamed protein product [Amoebophrya sp. A120]|eukprot:GSA120T00015397001.1